MARRRRLDPAAEWDGYRFFVHVDTHGHVRARSRHNTDLTDRVGDLLRGLEHLAAGTVLDGELVAVGDRDRRPAQDFAAVGRGVFGRYRRGADRLALVVFDLVADAGADVRREPWQDRDQRLRQLDLSSTRIRTIDNLPAKPSTHAELVELGFEGSILERPRSTYRAGRCSSWRKHKARHAVQGQLRTVIRGRGGKLHAICDVDGRRVVALTNRVSHGRPGASVTIVYSREDADGSLREPRIAPTTSPAAAHPFRDPPPGMSRARQRRNRRRNREMPPETCAAKRPPRLSGRPVLTSEAELANGTRRGLHADRRTSGTTAQG